MELPTKPLANVAKRIILGEFYDRFHRQQWFHRAEYVEDHPNHMRDTIEIHAKYNPVLEMKEVLEFMDKHHLAYEIIAQSHQG